MKKGFINLFLYFISGCTTENSKIPKNAKILAKKKVNIYDNLLIRFENKIGDLKTKKAPRKGAFKDLWAKGLNYPTF